MESSSKRARLAGNQELERSQYPGTCPLVQQSRLEKAARFYEQALSISVRKQEVYSARKNLSHVHKLLADFFEEHDKEGVLRTKFNDSQKLRAYHILESLNQLKIVLEAEDVQQVMGPEWSGHLEERARQTFRSYLDWLECEAESRSVFLCMIRRVHDKLPSFLRATCLYEEAESIFKDCLKQKVHGEHKMILGKLPECQRPLREAIDVAKRHGQVDKAETCQSLLDSVEFELYVAQANRDIHFGNELVQASVSDSEALNMDGVWDAIDFYHHAVVNLKEKDVESEAVAFSKLGAVYNMLKMKFEAKRNFKRCFELANTLKPRNLSGLDWYEKAMSALQRFQKEAAAADDKARQEARQPFLDALKDEMDKLSDAAFFGAKDLLELVYKEFPPKNPACTCNPLLSLKKQLLKAVSHYHPDKTGGRGGDEASSKDKKWEVLCEEITKCLTQVYEREFKQAM